MMDWNRFSNPRGLSRDDVVEIAYFLSELTPSQRKKLQRRTEQPPPIKTWDDIGFYAYYRTDESYRNTIGFMNMDLVSKKISYLLRSGEWRPILRKEEAAFKKRYRK